MKPFLLVIALALVWQINAQVAITTLTNSVARKTPDDTGHGTNDSAYLKEVTRPP